MTWPLKTAGGLLASGVIVLACSTTASRSSTNEDTRSVAQPIQGGVDDTVNRYAVGVCRGSAAGMCTAICSGTLILPNVVATARHCVDGSPDKVDCDQSPSFGARKGGSFFITTNPTIAQADTGWHRVQSIGVPSDDHICGNDIALLVLDKPVASAEATPVAPGVQYVMWDPLADYSLVFTAIGYGNSSPTEGAGTRRRKELISVLCIPGGRPDCPADFAAKEFTGGDGTCSGDSGSGAYEHRSFEKGAPVVLGVLSRGGESADAGNCIGSQYTRLDEHRDFVLDVARKASAEWTLYPEPEWTAPKPRAVRDAGVTPKPTGLAFGEECAVSSACATRLCVDRGDAVQICSQACTPGPTAGCPEGFECRRDVCVPPAPPKPVLATPPADDGCTVSHAPKQATSWGWAAGGALGLAAIARRRRRS